MSSPTAGSCHSLVLGRQALRCRLGWPGGLGATKGSARVYSKRPRERSHCGGLEALCLFYGASEMRSLRPAISRVTTKTANETITKVQASAMAAGRLVVLVV